MKKVIALTLFSSVVLAGCHSSSNNDTAMTSAIDSLASRDATSEPGTIDDAAGLQSDINARFGHADDDPVDVETGDTLQDVLDRAGS